MSCPTDNVKDGVFWYLSRFGRQKDWTGEYMRLYVTSVTINGYGDYTACELSYDAAGAYPFLTREDAAKALFQLSDRYGELQCSKM